MTDIVVNVFEGRKGDTGQGIPENSNYNLVSSLADFPTPVGGVITLPNKSSWTLTKNVDLAGNRIACEDVFIGSTAGTVAALSSTGLTGALITSNGTANIRRLTITAALVFAYNGNGTKGINIDSVNFLNCASLGSFTNLSNALIFNSAFVNSPGLQILESISSFVMQGCSIVLSSGILVNFPSSLIINRRIRIDSCVHVLNSSTFINLDVATVIPNDNYIINNNEFSGSGTYLTGVQPNNNKSRFFGNKGIDNSRSVAWATMKNNAVPTNVTVATPIILNGTFVNQPITQGFEISGNRITCKRTVENAYDVDVILSLTSGNNHQIGIYIARNGVIFEEFEPYVTTNGSGRRENMVTHGIFDLGFDDYIEIFVENNTSGTPIIVTDLSVRIK